MELKFEASVMRVGNGLVITIPKIVCDTFGIDKGDTVELRVTDDGMFVPFAEKGKTTMKEKAKHR